MRRNVLTCVLVLGLTFGVSTSLDGFGGTVQADISAESSTLALGQLVLRDDFNDNEKGPLWRLYNENPYTCGIFEANGRLEYRSIKTVANEFAGYISNAWRLDPTEDFSLRVDAYYDLVTHASGWITLGITPSAEAPRLRCIEFGIGSTGMLPVRWYKEIEEWPLDWGRVSRSQNHTVLYISYTAEDDTLYLSYTGYGPDNAGTVFPGILQGRWGGKPVFVYLGGRADGLAINSGHAYLDNLLVETGTIVQAALRGVYRFWSPLHESHFYTMSQREKERLLVEYPDIWIYEGARYHAYPDNSDPATRPVHRFWSAKLSRHFYTISESEKQVLIKEYDATWTYEGVAFYAYPEGKQPPWTRPVHRFWSAAKSAHFYSIDEVEIDHVLNTYGDIWTYEGIVWYANP